MFFLCIPLKAKRANTTAAHPKPNKNVNGMSNAEQYSKFNIVQRLENEKLLETYKKTFLSPKNAIFIDIGCGSGDVTAELLMPRLESTFEKLIGIDRSEDMVKHAQSNHKHPKMEFIQFDFAIDNCDALPKANHITSFYTFHWVQNQRKAFQDIYTILKPNGDCVLLYLAHVGCCYAYEKIHDNPRWKNYTGDGKQFIPPFQNATIHGKTKADCEALLKECNFSSFEVNVDDTYFDFDDFDHLKSNFLVFWMKFYKNEINRYIIEIHSRFP